MHSSNTKKIALYNACHAFTIFYFNIQCYHCSLSYISRYNLIVASTPPSVATVVFLPSYRLHTVVHNSNIIKFCVLTYFHPSVVLQHSQKISATACRPVNNTRSSAGPHPTFTLQFIYNTSVCIPTVYPGQDTSGWKTHGPGYLGVENSLGQDTSGWKTPWAKIPRGGKLHGPGFLSVDDSMETRAGESSTLKYPDMSTIFTIWAPTGGGRGKSRHPPPLEK